MGDRYNHDLGEPESEDEDFNPAPAIDSDDEAVASNKRGGNASRKKVSDSVKSRSEREKGASSGGRRGENGSRRAVDEDSADVGAGDNDEPRDGRAGRKGDADDDEEEDEEEEEEDDDDDADEDEEDEVTGHRRKRHKKDARLQFIDVEAEVDDEDEELEEDEEDVPGEQFIAEAHPDDLIDLPTAEQNDERRHRELDQQREVAAHLDAERQAAALKERYGRNRAAPVGSVVVPQRLLLPSVNDPTIWGVRCKQGKEREVVFSLMKRVEERRHTREPVQITAAFERGGSMAGYVYVEARRQAEVLTAMDGVTFAYPRTKMVLIPVNEMPDLLRTTKAKSLEPGMYVRIKRGKYAGDLAEVEDVETNGLDVSVRLVPRLDYGLNEDANAPVDAAKRKRAGGAAAFGAAGRPPPRLFSEIEARKKHARYLTSGRGLGAKEFSYLGDTYVNGFLTKDLKISHLRTEDVNPTLEEVTKFTAGAEDGGEALDLTALAATIKSSKSGLAYLPGDTVEVYQGEQTGVVGRAVAVQGDIVTVKVTEGEQKEQTVEVPMKGLRKRFREGDHVKVIGGNKYENEVGMIVKVKDDQVTFLNDSNNQEITVFSKDLREATDSGGTVGDSKYDLFDLVQLDAATVACVIKVDRESLRVLDQNGAVKLLLPSNISSKIERRKNAAATDRDGSEIQNDDTIKEANGEQRTGRVLHIHRHFLFAQNRQQTENAGVFVVRNTNVTTVAAKGGRVNNIGPDLTKMNPAMQRNGLNGAPGMPPPKTIGRDRLIGRTVTVRKGPYKGLLGIVKDTTDDAARVELHSKTKIITIPKDTLAIKDPVTGNSVDGGRYGTGRGYGSAADAGGYGMTPARPSDPWQSGNRTPAPAAGGGWNLSSRTPAWGADGSRTVNPYADGSRTAYGGVSSGSTWNPNSRTPYAGNSGYGGADPYSSGSKTPAYSGGMAFGGGNRTPAHASAWSTGNSASETPHGPSYDAPTPGFSAPTPGQSGVNDYYGTPRLYGESPRPSGGAAGGGGGGAGVGGGGRGGAGEGAGSGYGTYSTPAAGFTPGAFPDTPAPYTPAAGEDEDPRYE